MRLYHLYLFNLKESEASRANSKADYAARISAEITGGSKVLTRNVSLLFTHLEIAQRSPTGISPSFYISVGTMGEEPFSDASGKQIAWVGRANIYLHNEKFP